MDEPDDADGDAPLMDPNVAIPGAWLTRVPADTRARQASVAAVIGSAANVESAPGRDTRDPTAHLPPPHITAAAGTSVQRSLVRQELRPQQLPETDCARGRKRRQQ